jgi:hypothetical protein
MEIVPSNAFKLKPSTTSLTKKTIARLFPHSARDIGSKDRCVIKTHPNTRLEEDCIPTILHRWLKPPAPKITKPARRVVLADTTRPYRRGSKPSTNIHEYTIGGAEVISTQGRTPCALTGGGRNHPRMSKHEYANGGAEVISTHGRTPCALTGGGRNHPRMSKHEYANVEQPPSR